MNLVNTYVQAVRGPTGLQTSLKVNGQDMANDFAALEKGFDTLVLSEFTATAAADLNNALVADIYTDSGFKYNGATTQPIPAMGLVYDRTIDVNASAYSDLLFPTGVGLRDTSYEKGTSVVSGTSGDDTVNLNTADARTIYQGKGGNDDITISEGFGASMVFGGDGDDIIKSTSNSGSRILLDGGAGNDKLHDDSHHNVKFTGGDGNDVFIISYNLYKITHLFVVYVSYIANLMP